MSGLHDGHRQRMYEKVKKDALNEHEWLEVLLYAAIPRQNTNELAHRLLAKFKSVDGVMKASMDALQEVQGVGASVAAYLCTLGHFFRDYRKQEEPKYYGIFDPHSFLSFVKYAYENEEHEVADLYLLDGEGEVLVRQRFSLDCLFKVDVIPEELSAFLLTEQASGVVMVHNHPFGSAFPSEADDKMTINVQMLCSMHNRLLCEHVIYAPDGLFSYYLSGKIQDIGREYVFSRLLEEKYGRAKK